MFDSDRLCLIVEGIEKDTAYSLLLKDLELHYRGFDADVRMEGTPDIEPGKIFSLNIETDPESVKNARIFDLEVCDREWVLWRIRLDEKELATLKRSGACRMERPGFGNHLPFPIRPDPLV